MYTCVNGHLVCADCLMHQATVESAPRVSCAICRDASSWNRDRTAKVIMLAIEEGIGAPFMRCDNYGCHRCVSVESVDTHRSQCLFRHIMCPNERCNDHVPAIHLARHLRQHAETLVMQENNEMTALVFAFNLDCAIILEDASKEPLAVFHLHTNGIAGTPNVYELEQGVVRVCCLQSYETSATWKVCISNISAVELGAFETFSCRVKEGKSTAECRPSAHPSVRYKCDIRHAYAAPFVNIDNGSEASCAWLRKNRSAQRVISNVTPTQLFDPCAGNGSLRAAMSVPILILKIIFSREEEV